MIFLNINWPNFVYWLVDLGFLSILKFLCSIAVRSPMGWTPLTHTTDRDKRTNERTDGRSLTLKILNVDVNSVGLIPVRLSNQPGNRRPCSPCIKYEDNGIECIKYTCRASIFLNVGIKKIIFFISSLHDHLGARYFSIFNSFRYRPKKFSLPLTFFCSYLSNHLEFQNEILRTYLLSCHIAY